MGRDEEGTLAKLKSFRKTLVDPAIAEHRGHIVKTTGDGMLAEFASAVDATRCAIEVQRGMAERNASVPRELRIEFRIGIHVGDIIIDENDIFGDGVNIAARLEGIARSGGICISDDAHRHIRGKVDSVFDDMGPQVLKNIDEPVRTWAMQVGNATASTRDVSVGSSQPLALPDKPSIAVLPFQNLSGDPEQEYFADGMVEDIITALSHFKSLFVIARNSSFTYKGNAVDVKQVGRELGVRYILEGSVRKAGSRVRITGQLVEAATGGHLWADKFDGALEDVFGLQDQITTSVVGVIAPTLQQAEIERARQKPTDRLDSYDLYLRLLSRHYGRHIPGNPAVLPVNMPGASSLVLGNHLAKRASQDGTAFGAVPFVFGYALPYALGFTPWHGADLTAVLLGVVPLAFASAIVRYRLMDVEVIIKRALVYAAALAAIAAIYAVLLKLARYAFLGGSDKPNPVIALLATLVVVLLSRPVKNAIQTALDRVYYRDRYDYRRALVGFARDLNSDLDLLRLSERLVHRVMETLVVDRMALMLADERLGDFRTIGDLGSCSRFPGCRGRPA